MTVELGLSINLSDPAIIEVAGWIGYRFVWIDCEHTLFSNVGELVRAAEAVGIEPWIRVPRNESSEIGRYLNLGPTRIIVPHVRSAAEAAAAVRHTKFNPAGERNWFSKARDGRYSLVPSRDYPAFRSPSVKLVAQVEDPDGIAAIDEILDVPGVDMVMTGPGDLAHSLGIPGRFDDPRILAAEERVFDAADKRSIPVLHFADTEEELAALSRSHPVTHLVAGSDTSLMTNALRTRFAALGRKDEAV